MPSLGQFRKQVLQNTLFPPCKLEEAITRLAFVQADPIRSPARAQDLILRHRVKNYKTGDLERAYPAMRLEECYLYAYGFASHDLWQGIHPKSPDKLTGEQKNILKQIRENGPMQPKELEAHVAGKRKPNCWGGFSRTTKLMMEALHDRGALRIAGRNKGMRIYETADTFKQDLSKKERFKKIAATALKSMGATTRRFLLSELSHFGYLAETLQARKKCLEEMIHEGRIRTDLVDSVEYLSINNGNHKRRKLDSVRILAPFDPVVRDRSRFEHLWNWSYRFEAYVPKAKRKLGYYAMPVLWQDRIVGWANAAVTDDRLTVDFGYASGRPKERGYKAQAEMELARLAKFLGLAEKCWNVSL